MPIVLSELPLTQLKRHFTPDGIEELTTRLRLITDDELGRKFAGNFKAAAIAFMAHGWHDDGHTALFGHPHNLFSMLRGRESDYDVERVETVVDSTKNLMFDVVRAQSSVSCIFIH